MENRSIGLSNYTGEGSSGRRMDGEELLGERNDGALGGYMKTMVIVIQIRDLFICMT
jgi:hypothetical protein